MPRYNWLGGYIGYMTGSIGEIVPTDGVAMYNAEKNCYFIVTDAGVRMQAGDFSLYIVPDGKGPVVNGDLAVNGDLSTDGSYVKPDDWRYSSNSDSTETALESWLDGILANMKDFSSREILIECYPAITGETICARLYRHNVGYAVLEGFSYNRKLNIKSKNMQALAKAIAGQLAVCVADTDAPRIFPRIDELDEALLDALAWDFKVDWWDYDYSFDNANTAASPTLQVGDTETKKIVSRGKTYLLAEDYWEAGDYCIFLYDGTNWVLLFRFGTYIPMKQKGAAGGVATLAEDGKVVAPQLRGGFVISATQPTDTTLLWIDTKQVMRYYDASSKTWKPVLPVWG